MSGVSRTRSDVAKMNPWLDCVNSGGVNVFDSAVGGGPGGGVTWRGGSGDVAAARHVGARQEQIAVDLVVVGGRLCRADGRGE